jgi:hypothetical protein
MGLALGIAGVEEFIRDQLRHAADHPPYFWRDHCPRKIRLYLTYNPSRNVLFLRNYNKLAWEAPSRFALNTLLVSGCFIRSALLTYYLHGFVQRGGHPKLHLFTYDTSSPIYVSGDQSSFHFFMNDCDLVTCSTEFSGMVSYTYLRIQHTFFLHDIL